MKTWLLIALMHGAVTFDAWSTNRLMNAGPPGWQRGELNPIAVPFAGKKRLYVAANLVVVPVDIWLIKRPKSQKAKLLAAGLIGSSTALGLRNWRQNGRDWQEFNRRDADMRRKAAESLVPNSTVIDRRYGRAGSGVANGR